MKMTELESALRVKAARYKYCVLNGELGEAITIRDEVGKLVMVHAEAVIYALNRLNAPLSDGAEPGDQQEEVPF